MDGDRFDALARTLGAGRSRRGALKTLLGGALGGAAAVIGAGETDAKPTPKPPTDCCPPGNPTLCNLTCTATQTDVNNCGSCGHVCPTGASCHNGACACPTGQAVCNGACANLKSDPGNCGVCGTNCARPNETTSCSNGVCVFGACAAGFGNCDSNSANGCETNLLTSNANCGSCGHACAAGQTCVAGACAGAANGQPCTLDSGCNSGHCVNNVCCDGACPGATAGGCQSCASGSCAPLAAGSSCTGGVCDGAGTCVGCVGPANCPTPPNATPTCTSGTCSFVCNAGFGDCNGDPSDGCETNLLTTHDHCGNCLTACPPTGSCDNGLCNTPASCTDGVKNGQETDKDCGGPLCPQCVNGQMCQQGSDCQSGVCCGGICTSESDSSCGGGCANCQSGPVCQRGHCDPSQHICIPASQGTTCAPASCANGNATSSAVCDGAGACGTPTQTLCGAYACNASGTACNTACASNADCAAGNHCSSGTCVAGTVSCSTPADCPTPGPCQLPTCNGGVCGAINAGDTTPCDDGNACTTGGTCQSGSCVGVPVICTASDQCHDVGVCSPVTGCSNPAKSDGSACGSGDICCGGGCLDPSTDLGNCGACGHVCSAANATSVCNAGVCGILTCNPGYGDCNNNPSDGCEVHTANDPSNCGGCGNVCAAGQTCQNSACVSGGINGHACTLNTDCSSGFCANGVCCNAACTGICEACTQVLTGVADGTCALAHPGTECRVPNCSGGTYFPAQVCDAQGTCPTGTPIICGGAEPICNSSLGCVQCNVAIDCPASAAACGATACTNNLCVYPGSSTTCADPSCSGGTATSAATCDGAGNCGTPTQTLCGVYACNAAGTACNSTCASDSDCATGNHCSSGSCVATTGKGQGQACASDAECTSGFCVDSVCCNTACTGGCQACSQAKTGGANGTCASVPNGTDPNSACTDEGPCGHNGLCQNGACAFYSAATTCAAPTCSSGTATPAFMCSGAGTCVQQATIPCAPYICNGAGTACAATCATDAGCAAGAFCNSASHCVPKLANGGTCTGDSQCVSGFCVNNACAAAPCSGCTVNGVCYLTGALDPANSCQVCNPSFSTSAFSNVGNGIGCSDNNLCTTGTNCQNGSCVGVAVTCTALDQCHVAGICDPSTGCPNPTAADGTACGVPNASGATCTAGVCGGSITCFSGFGNCDGNAANGCETNLANDANNCGTCGNKCAAGHACVNLVCQ